MLCSSGQFPGYWGQLLSIHRGRDGVGKGGEANTWKEISDENSQKLETLGRHQFQFHITAQFTERLKELFYFS